MNKGGKKNEKVLSVVLALLVLCASILVAFAATTRFTIISYTFSSATRTLITADLGAHYNTSLSITAQVYRYSSAADDYMRSVKFEESASNRRDLGLYEEYSLNENDKVVFTFTAGGESYVETCYVH